MTRHRNSTFCASDHSFNAVSFKTSRKRMDLSGIEPLTPCLQSRCSPS
jgi:hypothetical protein